jgi:hypothetical protein
MTDFERARAGGPPLPADLESAIEEIKILRRRLIASHVKLTRIMNPKTLPKHIQTMRYYAIAEALGPRWNNDSEQANNVQGLRVAFEQLEKERNAALKRAERAELDAAVARSTSKLNFYAYQRLLSEKALAKPLARARRVRPKRPKKA